MVCVFRLSLRLGSPLGFEAATIFTVARLKKSWNRVRKKLARDFVRDPVDHVDFEIRADDFLTEIRNHVIRGSFHPAPAYPLPLPKSKGISRPTVSLDLADLIIYRVLVESLEARLLRRIPATAFHGGRLMPNPDVADFYERWWENWSRYQAYLRRLKRQGYRTFVVTDIAAYFEQIDLHLLRDMVAHECPGKKRMVDLLFFLLESKTARTHYARNTFRGLPQENFDCSRELAHFFLHPVDLHLQDWCRRNGARYARWADDFNVAVRSEQAAKSALKELTAYLRDLHLSASVEKTIILQGSGIDAHFYFAENEKLDRVERLLNRNRRRDVSLGKRLLRREYLKFRRKKGGNWKKVLKRFYTNFARIRSRRLVSESLDHLVRYPDMADKIFDYLAAQRFAPGILQTVERYLRSGENLYPGVEALALEFFLSWPIPHTRRNASRLTELGKAILFRRGYSPQSEYARSLACLLLYKFGSAADLTALADYYLASAESDYLLRKYLLAVGLTCQVPDRAAAILTKARLDPATSVKRLVEFVDVLRQSPRLPNSVTKKLRTFRIKFSGVPTLQVRRLLLAHLTFTYSPVANELRPRLRRIRDSVQDEFVRQKLAAFI